MKKEGKDYQILFNYINGYGITPNYALDKILYKEIISNKKITLTINNFVNRSNDTCLEKSEIEINLKKEKNNKFEYDIIDKSYCPMVSLIQLMLFDYIDKLEKDIKNNKIGNRI